MTRRNIPTYYSRMNQIDIFSALANPIRREILVRISNGPMNVTQLAKNFDIGRPAVSEHLQVLRNAQILRDSVRGRERYYYIDPTPLGIIESFLDKIRSDWKQRLDSLDIFLQEEP